MKKLILWSAVFTLLLLCSGCKDMKLDIQDLKDSFDMLEGTAIASMNEQISAISTSISDLHDVDKELQTVIGDLETKLADLQEEFDSLRLVDEHASQTLLNEIENHKTLIQSLQAKDAQLQNQISTLQSYVDTEFQKIADWAEATFATLEQYSAMQAEISAIKTLINKTKSDITEEYTTAIETAISNSETNMKAWVNTLLSQGYYTISDINGKVSALEALISDGDTNLQKQINDQKTAIQQAKADLINEYKQYINQAIAAGGIIDQAIASQVKKEQDALQSKIDIINERLESLEDRLGKLEEDFVNRIQSLKYISEYSDGRAKMSDFYKTTSLDFLISPSSQAKAVQNAWENNHDVVKAYLRCTKNPETKAISPAVPLVVVSVIGTADGILNVILKEDSTNPIDSNFFTGDRDAVVYVKVSDGNSDVFSDMVEVGSCIELSAYENLSPLVNGVYQTANCYIVSKSGAYKFKAYKGNSQELVGSYSNIHPIGDFHQAKVVWESLGDNGIPETIDLISYIDYEQDYLVFKTSNTFQEGNALISVHNNNGQILWSWHIWFTDSPQGYRNNIGTIMDRNLGATSSKQGDVYSLGLLYQWGRKDPFLGSSSVDSSNTASSTIEWPLPIRSEPSHGSIEYAILNPTTFIYSNDLNDDWYYTGSETVDKTRWVSSENAKTIYDPCPAGWRVPDYETLAGFDDGIYDSENHGMLYSDDSSSHTWFPSSGYRSGGLLDVGSSGWYWTASHSRCLNFSSSEYKFRSRIVSCGLSVRCQKE